MIYTKNIDKRINALIKSQKRKSYENVDPVTIAKRYNGHVSEIPYEEALKKATEEFYKKYPDYDGTLIILPEVDKLTDED